MTPRGSAKQPSRLPAEAGTAAEDRAAALLLELAGRGASDDDDPADLEGTVAFLDAVAELSPRARAKAGFKFKVYVAEGPRHYLPDSDWGETVPTEDEIAQRYGPGSYVVVVGKRRKGQGGGWCGEIRVRIAQPRTPGAPGASHAGGTLEGRLLSIVEQIALNRASRGRDDDEDAPAPAVAPELSAKLDELAAAASLAVKSGDASLIPEWAQPALGKLLERVLVPDAAPAAAPPASPPTGA